MNELKKTLSFVSVALVLVVLAFLSLPKSSTPDLLAEVGERFFPDFKDPNTAASLEVVAYDEETASAKPFKVVFKENLWVIPSDYNYPADGKEQLSKTAALMIAMEKEEFRTANPNEFEELGVVDPLDESTAKGRGMRITVRNQNDKALADIIIGKALQNKSDLYYVREPEKRQVFTAKVPFKISTAFKDWIDTDLLQVEKTAISEVMIKDYSINERTRSVNQREELMLSKNDEKWMLQAKRGKAQNANSEQVEKLLKALDEMTIVGVRPKPQGLSDNLTASESGIKISQEDMLSLQSKGYYFARNGDLLSNEGELEFKTTEGVRYILRFGEMVLGEISDGNKPEENRFLFITASFDDTMFQEPAKPGNMDFKTKPDSLWNANDKRNKSLNLAYESWQKKVEAGKKKALELNQRFAKWYYIIPGESFKTLDVGKKDLAEN